MPAPTLFSMATQAAIRAVDLTESFGDMPYEIVRPILLKITSPQQLVEIERNSTQIAESSEELWRAFIARDIPDFESKMVYPKNSSSWSKVYRYLQRQEDKKAAADEEELRQKMQGETLKRAHTETLFVPKVLPHARDEKETNKFIDGIARKDMNDWGIKKAAPTLKNAKTGKDMLAAIRKRTAENCRAKAMARPFAPGRQTQLQQFNSAKRQITQAPASMIRDRNPATLAIAPRELLPHEKVMLAENKKAQALTVIPPKTRLANAKLAERDKETIAAAARKAREVNEAKLRALTQSQKSKPPPQPTAKVEFAPSPVERPASPPKAAPMPSLEAAASYCPHMSNSPPNAAASPPARQPGSPESSTVPKVIRKRPPPTSIFMKNKKRKV